MYTSLNITWGISKTLYLGNQSLMPTQYYINIDGRARRASASKYISTPIQFKTQAKTFNSFKARCNVNCYYSNLSSSIPINRLYLRIYSHFD